MGEKELVISKIIRKIKEILQIQSRFYYDEDWYRELKKEATELISEKEFEQAVDEAVTAFLEKR